ncbi:conserved hypothetical protein [Burkholderia gladioli]|uniref:hypothetical protein n=1 Tax=Burkholderia gladioli TaxID=28095 RepID=UPI0016411FE2|nr:hypothetical protein [Burkholderia gladioli]CAG9214681.1 conserved hypothetical protein [Burkholderia gladioli]
MRAEEVDKGCKTLDASSRARAAHRQRREAASDAAHASPDAGPDAGPAHPERAATASRLPSCRPPCLAHALERAEPDA